MLSYFVMPSLNSRKLLTGRNSENLPKPMGRRLKGKWLNCGKEKFAPGQYHEPSHLSRNKFDRSFLSSLDVYRFGALSIEDLSNLFSYNPLGKIGLTRKKRLMVTAKGMKINDRSLLTMYQP